MKYNLIILAILAATIAGQAQTTSSDLNKQVEVTKQYAPSVERAIKLSPDPTMVDTVALRPIVNYQIIPQPWATTFGVAAISPVKINSWQKTQSKSLYIKAGGGAPLNSVVDAYGWINTARGSVGAYINHRGMWGDLKNGIDKKVSAHETQNLVGVAVNQRVAKRLYLDAQAGYEYQKVTKYGEFLHPLYPVLISSDPTKQSYSGETFQASIGHNFRDLSQLNFCVGVAGSLFTNGVDFGENSVAVFAKLGKRFAEKHTATLDVKFDGYFGADKLDYTNRTYTISPRYGFTYEQVKLSLGVDAVFDHLNGEDKSYLFPAVRADVDLASGYFVPFVTIDGQLTNNGLRNTARQNPYVVAGLTRPNTAQTNFRVGATGSISSQFSYTAFAGVTSYRDLTIIANLYTPENTCEFTALDPDKGSMFVVGGDLSGRISGSFTAKVSANLYSYDMDRLDKMGDKPDFDASLDLKYSFSQSLTAQAGVTAIGQRYFYQQLDATATSGAGTIVEWEKVGTVADLYAELNYRINKKIGVYIEGRNLLNEQLYPWGQYRGYGANCNAGVKIVF